MSLCHADYFELKTINAQKTQDENADLPPTPRMNVDRGPSCSRNGDITMIIV